MCDFIFHAAVHFALITVDCRNGATSAVQLIPKLWPFLNHSIRSVRRSALRTMSVLLATGRSKVGGSGPLFVLFFFSVALMSYVM